MAIAFIRTQPISRKTGRSAVAAASYRSGVCLMDERLGQVFDYTRRSGVEHTELLMPEKAGSAAAWDREQLWNAAEAAERRKDSRVAREWIGALPAELSREERIEVSRQFGKELSAAYGVAVDFALHEPSRRGDDRNFHVHYLATTREVRDGELREKAALEKGLDTVHVVQLREVWERTVNQALERAGKDERIDMRPFAEQRESALMAGDFIRAAALDREPTIHVGWQAMAMERRGHESERWNQHRTICEQNELRREQAIARAQFEVAVRSALSAQVRDSRNERGVTPSEEARRDSGPRPEPTALASAREAHCRPQQQDVLRSQESAAKALRELRSYELSHPYRVKLADHGFLRIKLLRWEDKQLLELRHTFTEALRSTQAAELRLRKTEAEFDRKAGGQQSMELGQQMDTERVQQMAGQLLERIEKDPHRRITMEEMQENHRQVMIQNQIAESAREHARNYEPSRPAQEEPKPQRAEEVDWQGPAALQLLKAELSSELQSRVEGYARTELAQGTAPETVRQGIEKWMLPPTPGAAEYAREVVARLENTVERTVPQYHREHER